MYARQNADSRPSRGLRIPSNYSGNAFSAEAEERQAPREDIKEREEPSDDTEQVSAEAPAADTAAPSESAVTAGISRIFGKSVSGGIGLEELLILGLVFLISQNDTKDDLAFLLLLLLFIR